MTLHIQYRDQRGRPLAKTFDAHTQREITIGRRFRNGATPDIFLSWDRTISRGRHACIFHESNTWKIKHLSRTGQTRLNGEALPLGVPRELPAHATLLVGHTELTIAHDQADTIPAGVISERRAPSDPTPEISETQRLNALAEITRVLTAGGDNSLERLLDVISAHFPAMHAGGIALYRDKELFNPAYLPPGRAEISYRLARRALENRYAFRWDRQTASPDSGRYTSLTGTTQALYAPILRGAKSLGVLYLHTQNTFSDADLALLTAISEIIGASAHFDPATAHLRLPSVFVSYAHADGDFVRKLVNDLRRQRVTVWADERLHGGRDWRDQLAYAIEQSDALALVMSPDSLGSEWVQWEIEQARAAHKPIFPLWYRECDAVPDDLARLQYIDLHADYQAGVLELVEELYALSGEADTSAHEPPALVRAPTRREKIRILFLAANPRDTTPLRLGEEIRTIQERIRGGKYRDQFDIIQQGWAARFSDWQQYLLEYRPHIVHFSGHGGATGELMLENDAGNAQPVTPKALGLLFGVLGHAHAADGVRLVVLNACFSAAQAEALARHVGCVLGMTRAVSDEASIAFAGAFYNALTFGESVQVAFNLAAAALALTDEDATPRLLTDGIDANDLVFCTKENEP